MPSMTHRSTYALDRDTVEAIRRLSVRWKVSKAEVVRRAIRGLAEQADNAGDDLTPADVVARYRGGAVSRSMQDVQREAARQRSERAAEEQARARRLPSG